MLRSSMNAKDSLVVEDPEAASRLLYAYAEAFAAPDSARLDSLQRAVEAVVAGERLNELREALGSAPQSGEPSLLHGDLWSGNVYPDTAGRPVLIDPAVYRGDPEVDLAMSELFGGFDPAFQRAYRSVRPVTPAYDRVRRRVYQLYPLLVHANLFGAGYAASARASAAAIVSRVDAW